MSYKRLTPCIFIAGGKAVRWFDDRTVLTEDVIALAKQYNANGADELLVFDLSDSDEDHEESIDLIKKINRIISIPMVADNTYDCKDTFYVFHDKILSYYKNIFELTINMKK